MGHMWVILVKRESTIGHICQPRYVYGWHGSYIGYVWVTLINTGSYMGQQSWNGILKNTAAYADCWVDDPMGTQQGSGVGRALTSSRFHARHSNNVLTQIPRRGIMQAFVLDASGVSLAKVSHVLRHPLKLCDIVLRLSYERDVTRVLLRQVQTSDWTTMSL